MRGECKPTKQNNSNHQKLRTSYKKRKQEDSQNDGQAGRNTYKFQEKEEFFNHVDLNRSNIYFKVRLYKVLNKFLALRNSSLSPSYLTRKTKIFIDIANKAALFEGSFSLGWG